MRRKIVVISLITLVSVLVALLVNAQDETDGTEDFPELGNIVIPVSVYVRGGATIDAMPLGEVTRGQFVDAINISEDGQWIFIQRGNLVGWINRDLVRWRDDIDNLPVRSSSAPPPTVDPAILSATPFIPTPTRTVSFVLPELDGAFVREGPGRNYNIFDVLPPDYSVDYPVGRDEDTAWILFQYTDNDTEEKRFGWISVLLVEWLVDLESLPVLSEDNLTPTTTFTPSNTPTITATPTATYTSTATSTATDTPTDTPTFTATSTPTNTSTATATSSNTPTATNTATPTPTLTFTPTVTASPTATDTPSVTPTTTRTDEPTVEPSQTYTVTNTASPTASQTATYTTTPTYTSTSTPTATETPTSTATPTSTVTLTQTPTATLEPTTTPTVTSSANITASPTSTETHTNTPTSTATLTLTHTVTNTPSPSDTPTATSSPTPTVTASPTYTETAIAAALVATDTVVPTQTTEPTATVTVTSSPTETATYTNTAVPTTLVPTNTVAPTQTTEPTAEITDEPTIIAQVVDSENPTPTQLSEFEITEVPPSSSDDGARFPIEAVVAGIIFLLLLLYVALYWNGLASVERYKDGFVIEDCPVCRTGNLHVEAKQERVFGIPRGRHTVRCDNCRSVLRETGNRRWRYAVDRMENPDLYERYNNKQIMTGELATLLIQNQSAQNSTTLPEFVDNDSDDET